MAEQGPTPEQIGGWLAAIAGAAVVVRQAARKVMGTDEPTWARDLIQAVQRNTESSDRMGEKLDRLSESIAVIRDRVPRA